MAKPPAKKSRAAQGRSTEDHSAEARAVAGRATEGRSIEDRSIEGLSIEDLADRLHSMAIHLLRLVRARDTAAGIGPARLSALSVIVFAGPVSLNDLARAEQVRPPTMSRIVDALEADGLARRRTNQRDRRALLIAATPRGATMLKQGRRRRVKFLAAHLRGLSGAERKQIEAAVRAVQKALTK